MPLDLLLQKKSDLCTLVQEAAEWVDTTNDHPFFLWRVEADKAKTINTLILNKLSEQV